jgi:SAM-dependent methyltransferase
MDPFVPALPDDAASTSPASRRSVAWKLCCGALLLGLVPALALAQPKLGDEAYQPEVGQPGKDVVWVPTPDDVVKAMLDMAQVTKKDYVVDLGSGDGKIAIAAARRGARAHGIEYNPDMVALSKRNAERAGVKNVTFVQGDIFESDFRDADVITLYLLPSLNEKLRPILLDMKPGTRVTSHQFDMGDWTPDEVRELDGRRALFWVVPAKVEGDWSVQIGSGPRAETLKLSLTQSFQKVSGRMVWGSRDAALDQPSLRGGRLVFTALDADGRRNRFEATAGHDGRMSGTVVGPNGQRRSFTATRS